MQGRNFSQPRTNLISRLCIALFIQYWRWLGGRDSMSVQNIICLTAMAAFSKNYATDLSGFIRSPPCLKNSPPNPINETPMPKPRSIKAGASW